MFVTPGSRAGRGAAINTLYNAMKAQTVSGTSFTPDFGNGRRTLFVFTATGNATINAPINMREGQSFVIYFIQDGTGSRTITLNSIYKKPGGTAPTASTAASSVDRFSGIVRLKSGVLTPEITALETGLA